MRLGNLAGLATVAVLAAACGAAPDGTTGDTRIERAGSQGGAAGGPAASESTEDVTVLTLLAAAAAAYKTYNDIKAFVATISGQPTPTDQILTELGQLQTQITSIDSQLTTLSAQIATLYPAVQQGSYISEQQNIAQQLALANSAIDEANEWVQTGKTGPQIGFALDHSLTAMETLSDPSYWSRLSPTPGGAKVFDPRMTLTAYTAALAARVGVLAVYDPNYRGVAEYRTEFQTQLDWLNQLSSLMEGNVQCDGFMPQTWNSGSFWTCSNCVDTVNGYQSVNDNLADNANTPLCTAENYSGSLSDAQSFFSYVNFYDRWQVLDAMGQHIVQAFAAGVQQDTTVVPIPVHLALTKVGGIGGIGGSGGVLGGGGGFALNPPAGWANPAPLVSEGLCLNAQMELAKCSGSADQTWTTPDWGSSGATGTIASAAVTPSSAETPATGGCIDAFGWDPDTGSDYDAVPQPCSGSPGEQWIFQQDGHVAWQKDPRYCLAVQDSVPPSVALRTCANTPSQIWSRTERIFVPVPVHPLPF